MKRIIPKEGEIPFDRGFIATYKVDTTLFGNYAQDTIEFEVYIHLGDSPAFADCKNALLYLSKINGKWYHEKYMYDAVYRTKNGRWAGVGRSDDYDHTLNMNTTIKPERIEFNDSLWFDINAYGHIPPWGFRSEHFKVKDNRAYPVMGNYIEELFTLKKTGVLKSRGLF